MTKSELVKALREATQAGMSDCMKALAECNDDLDAAQKWLKEKGIAKANKKAGAVAYEGIVKAGISNNKALIIEVNSQTDFTAKNENFVKLVDGIYNSVMSDVNETSSIDVEKVLYNGKPLKDAGVELTATTGEKIAFRRGDMYVAKGSEMISTYTHSNNKIATVIVFDNKISEEAGKDIAMHAAAMFPKYLNEKSISSEWLESEREVLAKQFQEELKAISNEKEKTEKQKREQIIIDGKVKKLIKEVCLVDQPFVKDPSKTVAQYAKENGAQIICMFRYELGEGIEKKVANFADEVAAQMK